MPDDIVLGKSICGDVRAVMGDIRLNRSSWSTVETVGIGMD